MKLVSRHEGVHLLDAGDRISVSVTHQIRINHDDSWIKAEATSSVRPGEDAQEAGDRVLTFVDDFVIKACERVAATVERHS